MRSITDTLNRLAALKRRHLPETPPSDRLSDLSEFGENPGQLRARCFIPTSLRPDAPLVVVLHGCLQTAAGYDYGSGWSRLADEQGFALLFPEQQRSNNSALCFNWFQPHDTKAGSGEALSIRQMVERMILDHHLDRNRIFVTGLSAGGAMSAAMLAAYPDVFAAGGIIAGLAAGSATTIPEAFDRMRGHGGLDGEALGELVRKSTLHTDRWPRLSIWHGDADQTVNPSNSRVLVGQWLNLHGLTDASALEANGQGHIHRAWRGPDGATVVEEYIVRGMGHGTPLHITADGYGVAGAYMLDAGISSTQRIAHFWDIAPAPEEVVLRRSMPKAAESTDRRYNHPAPALVTVPLQWRKAAGRARQTTYDARVDGIKGIIEGALRTAGLMK